MADKWHLVVRLTAVHRILLELDKNGDGMQVEQDVSYTCMEKHQMVIVEEAEDSILIHEDPMMVDAQKLITITGMFHVSRIMV